MVLRVLPVLPQLLRDPISGPPRGYHHGPSMAGSSYQAIESGVTSCEKRTHYAP